jgi:hypothetical protein
VRNEQRDNKVLEYVTPTGVAGPYDSSRGSSTLISMRDIFDSRPLAEAVDVLLEVGAVGRHASWHQMLEVCAQWQTHTLGLLRRLLKF